MIFIWFLLTIPQDRLICELWTRQLPGPAALVQACGTDQLDAYRLDVTRDNVVMCTLPAASLPWVVDDCHLTAPLDEYRLRIVEPKYQEAIGCTVTTSTADGRSHRTGELMDYTRPELNRDEQAQATDLAKTLFRKYGIKGVILALAGLCFENRRLVKEVNEHRAARGIAPLETFEV